MTDEQGRAISPRPPSLSAEERERRRGGFSPLDRLGAPPVDMTVFMDNVPAGTASAAVDEGTPAGDCLRACVATVLGLPLDDVPHFAQYVKHPCGTDEHLWWWALVGFCRWHGWTVRYVEHDDSSGPPAGWSLADGMSPRGHSHVAVAWDGEVVFDPHPSRAGLTKTDGWIAMEKPDA